MKSLSELLERFNRRPTDVTGVDIAPSGTYAVRIRKAGDQTILSAAEAFPRVELPNKVKPTGDVPVPEPVSVSPKLKAKYVCITVPGENAIVKLLNIPGQFNEEAESKLVQNLGVDDANNYRISYKLISEGHGKAESRVLAVALPEVEAKAAVGLFPSGLPAPYSLEIGGLATISAFLHSVRAKHEADAVGVIDFGVSATSFALFNKGLLALIRRFEFGTNSVLDKVQASLGVDRETAQGILTDGAFDISQSVSEAMDPLVKQLIVSRDFVERRENCRVSMLYASGELVASRDSLNELHSSVGLEVNPWNPFEGVTVQPEAIPENLRNQQWRFSSAAGACLAMLEES